MLMHMSAWVYSEFTLEAYAALVVHSREHPVDSTDHIIPLRDVIFVINTLKTGHVMCFELIDQNGRRCFTTFHDIDVRYVLRAL